MCFIEIKQKEAKLEHLQAKQPRSPLACFLVLPATMDMERERLMRREMVREARSPPMVDQPEGARALYCAPAPCGGVRHPFTSQVTCQGILDQPGPA